jgi:hypothetical protein
MLILFQISLLSWIEKIHLSLERKPSTLEGGASSTLFNFENLASFERNAVCESGFSRGESAQFVLNSPIHRIEDTQVFLERKPSTLEGAASSTLFPCENWVNYWKEYCHPLKVVKDPKRSIHLSWRNIYISKRKPSTLEGGTSSTLFPCENQVSFWMEYYLPISVFKGEKHTFFSK